MPQVAHCPSVCYPTEAAMGQASPFKPIALVVEDDVLQRQMLVMLLEESEMGVIQCQSAEEALLYWKRWAAACR